MASERPEYVAQHFAEAAMPLVAAEYWRRAGERAMERTAFIEAIGHYRKGIDALAPIADCICGRFDQACRLSLHALEQAQSYPHAFTLTYALMTRGFVQVLLHDSAGARETLQEASRRSADQEFALLQTWVTVFLMFSYVKDGLADEAVVSMTKSNAEVEKLGALLASPLLLSIEGSARLAHGHPLEAQRCVESAIEMIHSMQGYEYESIAYRTQGDILVTLEPNSS